MQTLQKRELIGWCKCTDVNAYFKRWLLYCFPFGILTHTCHRSPIKTSGNCVNLCIRASYAVFKNSVHFSSCAQVHAAGSSRGSHCYFGGLQANSITLGLNFFYSIYVFTPDWKRQRHLSVYVSVTIWWLTSSYPPLLPLFWSWFRVSVVSRSRWKPDHADAGVLLQLWERLPMNYTLHFER